MPRPRRAAWIVVALLIVVLGTVGAALGLSSTSTPQVNRQASAHRFLTRLFDAIKGGDSGFLLTTLSPIVRSDFPVATCRSFSEHLHVPGARFTVLDIGAPGVFHFTSKGAPRFSLADVLPVSVDVTIGAASSREIIHIAADGVGGYTWFGDCAIATR